MCEGNVPSRNPIKKTGDLWLHTLTTPWDPGLIRVYFCPRLVPETPKKVGIGPVDIFARPRAIMPVHHVLCSGTVISTLRNHVRGYSWMDYTGNCYPGHHHSYRLADCTDNRHIQPFLHPEKFVRGDTRPDPGCDEKTAGHDRAAARCGEESMQSSSRRPLPGSLPCGLPLRPQGRGT